MKGESGETPQREAVGYGSKSLGLRSCPDSFGEKLGRVRGGYLSLALLIRCTICLHAPGGTTDTSSISPTYANDCSRPRLLRVPRRQTQNRPGRLYSRRSLTPSCIGSNSQGEHLHQLRDTLDLHLEDLRRLALVEALPCSDLWERTAQEHQRIVFEPQKAAKLDLPMLLRSKGPVAGQVLKRQVGQVPMVRSAHA